MSLSPRQTADLLEWCAAVREGRAGSEEHVLLKQLVIENEEACRIYIRQMHLAAHLRWSFELSPTSDHRGKSILIETLRPPEPIRGIGLYAILMHRSVSTLKRSPVLSLLCIAMVTAVFWSGLMLLLSSHRNRPDAEAAPAFPNQPAIEVATILKVNDCLWERSGAPVNLVRTEALLPGTRIVRGERWRLKTGVAEIALDRGAKVLVSAPAEFELSTANSGFLFQGKLLAIVSAKAREFTVNTPTAKVVDLGTEFGVYVENRGVEVHVFTGKVEIHPLQAGFTSLRLEAGRAAKWEAGRLPQLAAADPLRFRHARPHLVDGSPQVNIALGKPIIAGSGAWNVGGLAPSDFGYAPQQVVDGDVSDDTGSFWVGRNMTPDEFFMIDLGSVQPLQRIELVNTHNSNSNDRGAKDCEIWIASEVFNGELIEPQLVGVVTLPDAAGSGSQLPVRAMHLWTPDSLSAPPEARFVKFVAKTYYGHGAGLNELRIFAVPNGRSKNSQTPGPDAAAKDRRQ